MARYNTLKAAIADAIKTNGQQQITGQSLQTQLLNMVTALGKYFQSFGGLATPAGSFSAGDESVTFLAVEAGTYTNFGGAVLDGKTLHILAYDGDWADVDTLIPSGAAFEAALALAIKGAQSGIAEGIADTISAGTAQEFLQRQSGGDGVNCIKRIKGKTIAWNQLVKNGDFSNGITEWNALNASQSVSEKVNTFTASAQYGGIYQTEIIIPEGHMVFASCEIKTTTPTDQIQYLAQYSGGTAAGATSAAASGWQRVVIFSSLPRGARNILIRDNRSSGWDAVQVRNVFLVDLTLLGLGDLTADQFRTLYPAIYAYNAGALKSNDAAALLTDGRNQLVEQPINRVRDSFPAFDKTKYTRVFGGVQYWLYHDALLVTNWRHCYKAYDLDGNEITTDLFSGSVGGAPYYVGGRWVDSANNTNASFDMTFARDCYVYIGFESGAITSSTPIPPTCLNLSDPSFNGTYEPYWSRVLALRLSELTGIPEGGTEADRVTMFPNGLRGLGTSYDEIAGGKATIRRGVRAYESGDESDASVITDGTNTDYALAIPIVYTDLQYADGTPFTMPATILVDNYGTERIQAPEGAATPSAPFCCDSNYSIGVANLVKRLAALENAE